eukprot:CAMPEP_0176346446 /NCGR_PEP_ID=MMETSP0126-20121128/6245_1 /TAXON_ID=141414 ORGANISM="Strombidinopsis acuminatum, Strain SPMC142" /NCGR_SAMPLE_ID=MMETSP0126 /ASSEMBLY_ACC=CAM_ASM_000229 /LENGTH=174 /DNA_ID=CAMNT_0017693989 /DNA_START=514 /DNA_END=1038 /DNA_ORIENTATION=+
MKKGEICYLKIGQSRHGGIYHQESMQARRTEDQRKKLKSEIGTDVYIKLTVSNIKREADFSDDKTFEARLKIFERVKLVCKEQIQEKEFSNAAKLYGRALSLFKNMSRKMRQELNEEEEEKRKEILNVLYLNLAFTYLKKGMYKEVIKQAKEALNVTKDNPKAHYRLYVAYKEQ